MTPVFLLLVAAVLIMQLFRFLRRKRNIALSLREFEGRPEQCHLWAAYGQPAVVQDFLTELGAALCLPPGVVNKIRPADRVMSLYRCVLAAPPVWNSGLDLAEAFLRLDDRFGGTLPQEISIEELTVGELFLFVVRMPQSAGELLRVLRRRW